MNKLVQIIAVFIWMFGSAVAQEVNCIAALNNVHTDSLVKFLRITTGQDSVVINGNKQVISSRYALHPHNVIAGDYLAETCLRYGFTVQDIPYSNSGRNIIAYKSGTQNDKPAFILCAHYDCVGTSNSTFQGADDNASGVAAMLEAARVLQNTNFPNTVVLAFWDEEEIGLLGSNAFAPDGPLGYWDVKGVINMDMIGYDGNNDSLAMIHTVQVGQSLNLATRLKELNVEYGIGLQTTLKNPGETATDQQSFWIKGATAVGLTEDYDNDFNPHWHQLSDSIDNLNIPYFTKMSRFAIAAICDIGQSGKITATEELLKTSFLIYPNPMVDKLQIVSEQNVFPLQLVLTNSLGEQILATTLTNIQTVIDTTKLQSGLYVITLTSNGKTSRQKLVKP